MIEIYGAGTAQFLPYWGSLLYPIPRIVFPEKPVSGSITADRFGTPSRLVGVYYQPGSSVYSVGVSSLATAVWHWGWIAGTLTFTSCVVLNLMLIEYCLRSIYILLRIAGISLLPIPYFPNLITSPDVFVRNFVTVIVLLILCRLVTNIKITVGKTTA